MTLRPVTEGDFDRLLAWRWAIGDHLDAEAHRLWCWARVGRPDWWMGEDGSGLPIGVIRIDDGGLVSIQVAPDRMNYGWGRRLLETLPADRNLMAKIHASNRASQRLFTRVGFRRVIGDDEVAYYVRLREWRHQVETT